MRFLNPDREPGINYWGRPIRKGKSQRDKLDKTKHQKTPNNKISEEEDTEDENNYEF